MILIPAQDGTQGSVSDVAGVVGTQSVTCVWTSLPPWGEALLQHQLLVVTGFYRVWSWDIHKTDLFFSSSFMRTHGISWFGREPQGQSSAAPVIYPLGSKQSNTATIVQEGILVGERDFRVWSLLCK